MYKLVVHWQDGRETVEAEGHNPTTVRAAEEKVARNSAAIRRIELHDHEGCVETIWDAGWSADHQDLPAARREFGTELREKLFPFKHPGRLHKALGVPEGEKIPASKLEKALKSKDPDIRRMANAAKNAIGISKKRRKKSKKRTDEFLGMFKNKGSSRFLAARQAMYAEVWKTVAAINARYNTTAKIVWTKDTEKEPWWSAFGDVEKAIERASELPGVAYQFDVRYDDVRETIKGVLDELGGFDANMSKLVTLDDVPCGEIAVGADESDAGLPYLFVNGFYYTPKDEKAVVADQDGEAEGGAYRSMKDSSITISEKSLGSLSRRIDAILDEMTMDEDDFLRVYLWSEGYGKWYYGTATEDHYHGSFPRKDGAKAAAMERYEGREIMFVDGKAPKKLRTDVVTEEDQSDEAKVDGWVDDTREVLSGHEEDIRYLISGAKSKEMKDLIEAFKKNAKTPRGKKIVKDVLPDLFKRFLSKNPNFKREVDRIIEENKGTLTEGIVRGFIIGVAILIGGAIGLGGAGIGGGIAFLVLTIIAIIAAGIGAAIKESDDEQPYVDHFWKKRKSADHIAGPSYFFIVTDEDRTAFPELEDVYGVALRENQDDSIDCVEFGSEEDYEADLDMYDEDHPEELDEGVLPTADAKALGHKIHDVGGPPFFVIRQRLDGSADFHGEIVGRGYDDADDAYAACPKSTRTERYFVRSSDWLRIHQPNLLPKEEVAEDSHVYGGIVMKGDGYVLEKYDHGKLFKLYHGTKVVVIEGEEAVEFETELHGYEDRNTGSEVTDGQILAYMWNDLGYGELAVDAHPTTQHA